MKEERATFFCGDISLEGIWHLPEGSDPFACVVICHPHPLYGGDMHNNVVVAICRKLAQESILAFRFNFRGVGESQGNFEQGSGEQEDIRAALDFISSLKQVDPSKIGLAGYSFGAKVALWVALKEERVKAVALISPPLSPSDWESLSGDSKAKLFLCGARDHVVSGEDIKRYVPRLSLGRYEIVPEVDHFWWGYEKELAQKVSAFFATLLR